MNQKYSFIILLLISSLTLFFYLVIYQKKSYKQGTNKLLIVCTTSIITDAVKQVVGDHAIVVGLMGPGIDPHIYQARESDVIKLTQADIVFYNGLHLEGKMASILEHLQGSTAITVTNSIDKKKLRRAEENIYDPHVWFDVKLWIQAVEHIRDTLMNIDQPHDADYQTNAQRYTKQLDNLDQYMHKKVKELLPSQRILVTAHDAFGYFGNAYGFKVIGLQGISTNAEPGTKDINVLVEFIVGNKIPALFSESSIPQRNIQAVQHAVKARGWGVTIGSDLYSDALGPKGSEQETYIGMVRYNVDTIVNALNYHEVY